MTLFVPNTSSKASAAPDVVYPSWKEERRRFLDTTGRGPLAADLSSLLPLDDLPAIVFCDHCNRPVLASAAEKHRSLCIPSIHSEHSESVFSIVSSVSQRGDIETAAIQQMIRQEHVVERGPSVCMFPDPTVIYGGEVGLADDKQATRRD
ncbi:hypothetical protein WA538_000349 [Blastocystis sp. DL]